MSKRRSANEPKPLPDCKRDIGTLLDKSYEYVHAIPWVDHGGGVLTHSIRVSETDPDLGMDGVWGVITRFVVKTKDSRSRICFRTKTPRRGFANVSKAVAFARRAIEDADEKLNAQKPDPLTDEQALVKLLNEAYARDAIRGDHEYTEHTRLKNASCVLNNHIEAIHE